jgi:hypothetical protein
LKSWEQDEHDFKLNLENVVLPSRDQNMKEHWDMEGNLKGETERFKFEVKGPKRFNRAYELKRNLPIQDEMMCVEYQNVNGDIGWVKGKSDMIPQKRKKYAWLIVPTKALWEMVRPKLNQEDIYAKATVPWSFKKKPYVIWDRSTFKNLRTGKYNDDRCAWVPFEDVEKIEGVIKLEK